MKISGAIIQGDPPSYIIPIAELSRGYKMGQDALRARVKDKVYIVFKELIVKKELLRELKDKLLLQKYGEARRIIEEFGLPNPDEVLAYLGFTVQWKGLDINAATIKLQ